MKMKRQPRTERAAVALLKERRRAGEERDRANRYAESDQMHRGLLRDTTRKLEALREEVARAKKIAGAMSVLWSEPKTIPHGGKPGDAVMVDVGEPAPMTPSSAMLLDRFTRMPLDVVLTSVSNRALDTCVHARVAYRDGVVAYGFTDDAMRCLESADELEYQVTRQIAPALVRELFDKAAPWRRNRSRSWR